MKAKTKWKWTFALIGLGNVLTVLFPVAWVLSGFGNWNIKWLYPFWLSLDDTRLDKSKESGLADDYEIYLDRYKFKPLGVFMWHIARNRVWNLVESFNIPNQEEDLLVGNQNIVVTKWISDELTDGNPGNDDPDSIFYGKKIVQDGPWAAGAGLKFVGKPGENKWQVNSGDIIAKSTSIIGRGEIEYLVGTWEGWRKTSCRKVKPWWLFGGERWRTYYRGFNAHRPAWKWKHQKIKPWGEWEQ